MDNLSKAEKDIVRDFHSFLIRNKLEFVTWRDDELKFIFLANNEETGGEENIFLRIQELAEEIGIRTI